MIKGLFSLAGKARHLAVISGLILILKSAASAAAVLCLCGCIDQAFLSDPDPVRALRYIVIMVALTAVRLGLTALNSRLAFRISGTATEELRSRFFKKLIAIEKVPAGSGSSAVINQWVDGIEAMNPFFCRFVPQIFASFGIPLVLFVILAGMSLPGALALLAALPMIPLSLMLIMSWASKRMGAFWNNYGDLSGAFLESLQGMTTLKLLGRDGDMLSDLDARSEEFRKTTMSLLRMQLTSTTVMDLCVYLFGLIGIGFGLWEYARGNLGPGGAAAFLLLSVEFFLPIRLLGSYFHAGTNGISAGKKILEFLESEEPLKTQTLPSSEAFDSLVLKNAGFSYTNDRQILSDIDLVLNETGLTVIAGPSGSGKSTLGKILAGLEKPDEGSLLVNGRSVSGRTVLVGGDSAVFDGTLEENLLLGNPDAEREELKNAMLMAGLDDLFVNGSPDWTLETGDRGCRLSGGQKQRLALARALLKEADLYVFDEAAANVDRETEEKIRETIISLSVRKCVVLITHRLKGLENASEIIVLENGKITERGTHDELKSTSGLYRRMFEEQQQLESLVSEEIYEKA